MCGDIPVYKGDSAILGMCSLIGLCSYMISRVIIDNNVLGLGTLFGEKGLFRQFPDKGTPPDVSKMVIFALLTK
jgi:CRP-like cAMP-binding protein